MNHTIKSLIFVVEQSTHQVRDLSDRLKDAKGKTVEPILRALGKEADTLSGALTRLSRHYVDHLPEEGKQPSGKEQDDSDFLYIVQLLEVARQRGFCDRCGGVLLNA